MYNFKGFTEPANMALNHAIEAAGNLGHTYIAVSYTHLDVYKRQLIFQEMLIIHM